MNSLPTSTTVANRQKCNAACSNKPSTISTGPYAWNPKNRYIMPNGPWSDYRIGEFAEALSSAKKSAELNPEFGDAYRLMGICQLKLNRREEGLAHLKKAAELGDESAQAILTEEETKQ